ncbi:MAG: CHASE domain-containing protein, partial [Rhodospirillales bacterium]|nr:CHASE domain-containing protein [Rhodospirillales bacterium]
MKTDWLKSNRDDKRKSFTHPVFITFLSIAIVIVAVFYVRGWENEKLLKDFNFSANTYRQLLEGRLREIVAELDASKRFFQGSTFVDRTEFSSFVTKAIIKSEEIKAISWAPRIPNDLRKSFEASQQGLNGRLIHVHDPSNLDTHNHPAPPRENYYPVLYGEPAGKMDDMTGFDLGSNPAVLELLEQARDDGVIVPITGIYSPYFVFIGAETVKSNVSLVQPVYQTADPLETIKQRRETFSGFLLLQFDIGHALEATLSALQPKGIDIYIVDVEADDGAEIVYHHRSRLGEDKQTLTYSELWKTTEFGQKSSLNISGRQWKVMMVPQPSFFEAHQQYQSWGVLLFGLLLSALLSYVLFMNQRRTDIIRDTVKIRTQEFEESEYRLSLALRASNAGYWARDLRTQEIIWSDENARLLGYEPGQPKASFENWISSIHPDEREFVSKTFFKSIADQSEINLEYRVILPSGDIRWINNIGSSIIDKNGETIVVTGIQFDITERKLIEEKVTAAMKSVEIANRAKSDLLANMSHELRTPLNAIIGFSETMKQETFGPIGSDKNREYLEDIHQSGQHLLGLINDILDVSAIEAGAMELHEENVNLSHVVDASVRLIRARAEAGQVSVISSLDPEISLIFADRRRVMQVMLNLLSNAVKFTLEDGKVDVNAQLNDDSSLAVSVVDSGFGMNAKEIDTAMSQFGQVDSGLDRKHEGTGLGLP